MPDLNSLPPSGAASPLQSRSMSQAQEAIRNSTPSPTSHSPSRSLAAAAAMNAGIHNEESRRSSSTSLRTRGVERRRSSIRMSLNLNDPTQPAPGELQTSPGLRNPSIPWTVSPRHSRTPSLGELHQELESEQEAQVNRLLHMIRQQQTQIQALQASQQTSTTAIDDSTPTSERSMSLSQVPPSSVTNSQSNNISAPRPRSPFPNTLSRQSSYRSRTSSRQGSPALHPMSGTAGSYGETSDFTLAGSGNRDESAFYQAETQMLTRENQMLKQRIRELERQLNELHPTSPNAHTPATPSNLAGESSTDTG